MAAPQNFRSAFNGFNREDVVRYLEYLNSKHTTQVNQLISEADFLRSKLDARQESPDQAEAIAALEAERDALLSQVAQLQERCAQLEAQLAQSAPAECAYTEAQELETYRRAERTERLARERAELIYHQANGVLAEAAARVDSAASDIVPMADQALTQLNQLLSAVSSGKQALQEAVSIMNTIRPNN